MATISKKAASRISELLMEIDLYRGLGRLSAGQGTGEYWRYVLTEGLAVRALFDEFGIEEVGLGYNTVERIEQLKIEAEAEAKRKRAAAEAEQEA
jgi:hypothetical protein